jgi:hypothetical protein
VHKKRIIYISHIPYVSIVGRMMFAIKCSRLDISHTDGVVSGHMVNPKHWKWDLEYLTGTVCGYVNLYLPGDLDKRRSTLGYVLHECKDLLGKFGQVQDKIL